MPESLYEVIYGSVIAPHETPAVVPAILARARAANAANGITGLLVFDGMRFLQHIEGPPANVGRLWERIASDPRHTDVRVIYRGVLAQRRYKRFEMGFAEPPETEDVDSLGGLMGEAALQRFLALRAQFDIQG
ncbi:BLUF domain-containing protein [Variovorax sp. J22R133]|uniref:BLUF domain-containing protein n=1 Tax=Variovorax brevis TaxID=3053503 RepID=UPI0025768CFA|nr:BLUF domain-containing protein [Variovorax sp. J22R133]MDM0115119.1 BLUF domain-containing protein [Variovorax sp. J22R133]